MRYVYGIFSCNPRIRNEAPKPSYFYPFMHLLERTIQQVPLVALARDLGELELISDLSQPIRRTPFRNCDPISQTPGWGKLQGQMHIHKLKWLKVEPAHNCGIFLGPPVVADGRPVEIHVSLRHSRTRAAFGLSLQADLSCDEDVHL